jgi:hypothetical protein
MKILIRLHNNDDWGGEKLVGVMQLDLIFLPKKQPKPSFPDFLVNFFH